MGPELTGLTDHSSVAALKRILKSDLIEMYIQLHTDYERLVGAAELVLDGIDPGCDLDGIRHSAALWRLARALNDESVTARTRIKQGMERYRQKDDEIKNLWRTVHDQV